MAHAARLSDLTDGLVRSVAGDRSQHASFRRMRDQAAKTFRNTTHARTNQFDVQSKLTGLVEKFAVLNREDLSDALQARLDELPTNSKWMPEILSLLLQLSDRPLEKTRIEDVEVLSKALEDERPEVTWDDLVADRALDETGLWNDVERGYHSSGDEAVDEEAGSDDTSSTKATTVEEDTIALAKLHIIEPDASALDDFEEAGRQLQAPVSELTLVRETLFMLRGLPTKLYAIQESGSNVIIRTGVDLETASRASISDLLLQLRETGAALSSLRHWARQAEKRPYMQSCQATTSTLITDFDREISSIEQRYVAPAQDVVVSLISVQNEIYIAAKPLVHLARITSTTKDSKSPPFALLDALYEEISVAEMSGEDRVFRALVQVFLSGFWILYVVGALAIGYLALYAYVAFTGRSYSPAIPSTCSASPTRRAIRRSYKSSLPYAQLRARQGRLAEKEYAKPKVLRAGRQLSLRQGHEVAHAERQRFIIEIVFRGVDGRKGSVFGNAIAEHDVIAGALLQHEGKILRAGHRRHRGFDLSVAGDLNGATAIAVAVQSASLTRGAKMRSYCSSAVQPWTAAIACATSPSRRSRIHAPSRRSCVWCRE